MNARLGDREEEEFNDQLKENEGGRGKGDEDEGIKATQRAPTS